MKLIKRSYYLLFASLLVFMGCSSNSGVSTNTDLSSNIDSVSYAIGYQIGSQSLKQNGMTDVKPAKLASGIKSALEDGETQLADSTISSLMQSYQMKAQQKAQQEKMAAAKENKEKGEEFLAENKNKEGVKTTESGLQYKELEKGSGVKPDSSDVVRVDYEGSLIDGTVFDSSYERGKPATFPLNRVIPGWSEGLTHMREGAKYKLFIPGSLAYGMNPPPRSDIGASQTLIFEVELLKVNPEESSN